MSDSAIPTRNDSDDLFARARAGDEAAWEQLFSECYDKVLRVVRMRMGRPMRSLYDSSDFANDVFKSLVAKFDRFDFPNIEALKSHLCKAATQKLVDAHRYQHCQKRSIKRNQPLHALDEDSPGFEPVAQDPSPSQFAQARETREQILATSSERERCLVELKLQELSNEEVAQQTGHPLRNVQRALKKLSDSWQARTGS